MIYLQVGINTTAPTKTLDVNGDARIRNLPTLTSSTVSPLFSDENGVLGKATIAPQSQVAFNTSTNAFPFSASNYNTGAPQTIPITSGHAVLNTIGATIGTSGRIMINQPGIYMLSGSVNLQLDITDDAEGVVFQ
ncbi:hypothetical protein REB14_15700 [Chryseobacterium sp. ES2]|uniref:BclA C-terminal domain-containing protein n=1 Tax=Chryseobacterium metallicongregator TaxID=3073042 RepID=A0ABU1E752_9FLAO|nr:hypothetical protein [Chryseobacterium sp. ES2]MDR4953623.1 hypothetical protein [Chryseobacterium sp. ES2]